MNEKNIIRDKESTLQLELGYLATNNFYEWQSNRISAMNRIRNIVFRYETGLDLREVQDKKIPTEEEKKWLKEYQDSKLIKKIGEVMQNATPEQREYLQKMLDLLKDVEEKERNYQKLVLSFISKEPVWTEWLENLRGVGCLMTSSLLYYFGYCEKARHASSLWKYAGLTPDSKHVKGESSKFNTRCRMMMWRLGDSFIKQRTPFYRDIYDSEKARQMKLLEEGSPFAPSRLGHADARARRKMVKRFLADYFVKCCELTGRPVEPPYSHRDDKLWVPPK